MTRLEDEIDRAFRAGMQAGRLMERARLLDLSHNDLTRERDERFAERHPEFADWPVASIAPAPAPSADVIPLHPARRSAPRGVGRRGADPTPEGGAGA